MQCCSCGQYKASSVRLAALRQSAARCHGGNGEWNLHNGPPTSAFTVYCNCTKQRSIPVTSTDVGYFIPPAAAADHILTRWRYWSLMFYRPLSQLFQHLESSAWMNFRFLHHRQQQQNQQKQIVIRKRPQSVRGKPAGVSATSARHYLCRSCSYSTDRKNNLKRHVITMHRQRTNFQRTARFPVTWPTTQHTRVCGFNTSRKNNMLWIFNAYTS